MHPLAMGFWPEQFIPVKKVFGVVLDKIDSFHELVMVDELNRIGSVGILRGIFTGPCKLYLFNFLNIKKALGYPPF